MLSGGRVDDPRKYYNQECYAMRGCLHCADCLAFALKYLNEVESGRGEAETPPTAGSRKRLVTKFIISTISSENLPCEKALSAESLKEYIKGLLEGEGEIPICHYEFR